jgi:hypothetical protein
MTRHIILANRDILAKNFALRSEAELYFSENFCVSINKIGYFCQHFLFHPIGRVILAKICCLIMTMHVISDNTCSSALDMTDHLDIHFDVSS